MEVEIIAECQALVDYVIPALEASSHPGTLEGCATLASVTAKRLDEAVRAGADVEQIRSLAGEAGAAMARLLEWCKESPGGIESAH